MRRFLIPFAMIMLACQALTPQVASPLPVNSISSTPTLAPSTTPTISNLPLPSQTLVPTPTPEVTFNARLHPDGDLYVSDLISIEIIAPPEEDLGDKEVQAQVISPISKDLGAAEFQPFGIGGRHQATLQWVWDTSDLEPGDYTLEFFVRPRGAEWTESVVLHPQSRILPPQPEAQWESAEIDCCTVHYITGTNAARDLSSILRQTDEKADAAAQRIRAEFDRLVPFTLLPRVLGHGGFASDEVYVSYLDRNYAGVDYAQVVHHELIHILDSRLGGDLRPTILVEGLAVYLSGGHYKTEPIIARAATLLDLSLYIPLGPLSDDFYTSQHEIGYIEAGALVQYLVGTYGWEAFSNFYRDIHPDSSGKQSLAIDDALQDHFGITFTQLEDRFLSTLRQRILNPDLRDDVRLTIAFYDTVRRYQRLMDPSAYFLTAWLPSGEQMRQRGIVADYLRHPTTTNNVAIENMLVLADGYLRAGRYAETEKIISEVNYILSNLDIPASDPLAVQ